MSNGDGIPYKSQNPIQIHLDRKNFDFKSSENEQNLVVYWNEEDFIENSSQEKSKEIICHLEGYSLDDLVFTGSEFDNVVLVAGRNIDTTSREFLIVLYKIISRARKTLKVFSHPSNLAEFKALLTLSDTDVYFDKQRCDNNFSSIAFQDIEELEFSENGKLVLAMMALEEDPQYLYNKAFLQSLKADQRFFNPIMNLSADRHSSVLKNFNLDPKLARAYTHMFRNAPLLIRLKDKSEVFDLLCKCVDAEFSTAAEFRESVFPVEELPFPEIEQLLLDSLQYLLLPILKLGTDTMGPFLFKSISASYFLNAEQFWQFLERQAITLEKVLTKANGSFWFIIFALSKLHPDQFTKLLKSVGVDSLKLSNEQFLDDKKNNILMYCVSKTRSFYVIADCVRKQDYLEELLSQRNCDGETCFVLACKHDNFGLVKMLLQKYQYNWLRDGFNAILALCKNGNILIFKHLLSTLKGDNVKMKLNSMRGSKGENILMITTLNTKMMETFLNFLIEEKLFNILLYEKDALGCSCLFWAAEFQNIESIRMLIERYKYNWKTDRYIQGQTIAHILCASKRLDVLKFFVTNYGHEFIKVAKELDYAGCSCLETACCVGRSVEVVQMVLYSLNDSLPLPQNFRQLLRCLVLASKGNGENKNKILDYLVSHMLEKLSLGFHENEIEQHYLVYASDFEDILKIGVRILVGPEELEEADSGEPETFSLGSWKCIFWALSECKEIRILTNQPICKMPAILTLWEGNGIKIFASWEYLKFLMDKLGSHRLPESCSCTSFKSWDQLYAMEFTGLEKHITRKCFKEISNNEIVQLLEDMDLDWIWRGLRSHVQFSILILHWTFIAQHKINWSSNNKLTNQSREMDQSWLVWLLRKKDRYILLIFITELLKLGQLNRLSFFPVFTTSTLFFLCRLSSGKGQKFLLSLIYCFALLLIWLP